MPIARIGVSLPEGLFEQAKITAKEECYTSLSSYVCHLIREDVRSNMEFRNRVKVDRRTMEVMPKTNPSTVGRPAHSTARKRIGQLVKGILPNFEIRQQKMGQEAYEKSEFKIIREELRDLIDKNDYDGVLTFMASKKWQKVLP